ncbi:lantibiotic dehydratase [Crossiella cryophila]|uniref:Thiopeptide-type bacteriocin biosynthesis protein n=1 Tax=Crossiella cryophila TaxID=43355 RepID=A0A7W7FY05_9PSEU|nr:lantibiotic dehydratase [Crossiella cryophila]MBB4679539.1 thiopeptide-type bacteriocin biosynthesis protein [Crossiella cryophila]
MTESRYRATDFYLVRAPALPAETFRELLAGEGTDEQRRDLAWTRLRELAATPGVRRALSVASTDLLDALDRLGPDGSGKKSRRAHSRLLRYLTRMSTRPTPFGAFSGIALGEFGEHTTLRLGAPAVHQARVRADMGWLLALIKDLEQDPGLRPHLRLVRNAAAHLSGDRLILPYADIYGSGDNRSVRVRATPAVTAVLRLAATPTPADALVAGLAQEFPEVAADRVAGLVEQLRELNFLISDLRPPQSSPFPEQHVAKRLTGIEAATATGEALREIIDLTHRAAASTDTAPLRELRAAQRALVPGHDSDTFQLDSTLDLRESGLGRAVGQAVAEAVDCLMRLAAALPGHNHHLVQYRDAFVERYGDQALVPVLEVLSPDTGLDAPYNYLEPPRATPVPHNTPEPSTVDYDRLLTEFAAQAWWSGAVSVELTDAWLDRIAPATGKSALGLYPALDVYAQLQLTDQDSRVDDGRWRLVLRELSLAYGGRTAGRFFDLLGEDALDHLREHTRRMTSLQPEAVHAELCFLPTSGRAANVAFRPLLHEYEVPVNATPSARSERTISLADLHVGVAGNRFYLWSRTLGREVVVSQGHMLGPHLGPNAARFVLEVSQDGYAMPTGFRWGPLEDLPFLPRVTRGNVVLRPAQWTLRGADVTGDFPAALAEWRQRWRVPRYVYLVDEDNRLLLDLDHPLGLDELAGDFRDGQGQAVLHEMLPAFDDLWLSDVDGAKYLEEIVVPLVAHSAADTARSPVPLSGRLESITEVGASRSLRRRHLPGEEWAYLKVYAAFNRHDEIIAGGLREHIAALRAQGLIDRWFYLRYADPQPHLRIRCRAADPDAATEVLHRLMAWGREVVASDLAFDTGVATYLPEIERYGGPRTFEAVEDLFTVNSDVTADLVALLQEKEPKLRPDFVAIATVDTLYRQWGLAPRERPALIPPVTETEAVRKEFHAHRDYLGELVLPWDFRPHEEGRAHHELINEILAPQAGAVAAAAAAVRAAIDGDTLWGTEATVLGSLAHMQINRLLPVDLLREQHCYALWRHILRAVGGRPAHLRKES